MGTQTWFTSSRRRATVLGACTVAVIGGIGVLGSSISAQTVPVVVEPVVIEPRREHHGAVEDQRRMLAVLTER